MKKVLAWLVLIFIIFECVAPFFFIKQDGGRAFRTSDAIERDGVYLDDEAIALSDNPNEAGLRSEAIKEYNLVNQIREEAGLDSLSWDENLESTSSVRSQESSIYFSHTRPNGKAWYTVNSTIQGGENLAFGFSDAESATDAWMESPTHRDNILYPDFEKVAISIYETDDGTCYWAQEFGY